MKPIKLDKKDYFRALLTDTIPADVPIIFSNAGLYINSHIVKNDKDNQRTKVVKYLYELLIRPELDENLLVKKRKPAALTVNVKPETSMLAFARFNNSPTLEPIRYNWKVFKPEKAVFMGDEKADSMFNELPLFTK